MSDCRNLGTCYSPRALRAAYGIQPLLDRGIAGRDVTVVLLESGRAAGRGLRSCLPLMAVA